MPGRPPVDLGSWIARRAAISAQRRAVTYGDSTWTYAEFADRVDRLAAVLVAGGVQTGDRVGYVGFNHPDFLTTMFAASRAGAVFVPLNFRLTSAELEYILTDAGVHTLVADADRAAVVEPVRESSGLRRAIALTPVDGWERLDDALSATEPISDPQAPGEDDLALIMYTSGTTGRPKGAMLTHGNMFWNNMNALLSLDTLSTDVSLVAAPLFHIGGLNVTTLITLQKGGELVILPAFDPTAALELIEKHRVTTMFGVPAMFLFMSQVPAFETADLSSVRQFTCGGAPVPESLITLYNGRSIPFCQGYGLTETAPLALVMGVDDTARKVGAAGHHILPLSEVALLGPDGAPVPDGERGEVSVRGPQVTPGYWRNEAATAAAIDDDGWFHTGDVGEQDADGFVTVVDRVKDMVISGGENVYPAEVESVLYRHPSVAEVAIIGTPDEKWGEAVTAIVALKPGASLTLEEAREFARDSLAPYKLPLALHVVDALPRNPAGKVLKFQLREQV
ncbi:long-chain fatty acid--CoA ligase [Tsukamurella sp. 1534]|uniref:acyl-CoA synthetase n=1 Tax=Tsukamurella sp. 1534 TaxID=1151061 RepID=UPI000312E4B3|nr:long-chain fatty acid--CoA ligase [Tsukamurella sp. 1534]